MSDSDERSPVSPTALDKLRAARMSGLASLGQLVVQRERLATTLANVDAKIAAHRSDIEALDKALGVVEDA